MRSGALAGLRRSLLGPPRRATADPKFDGHRLDGIERWAGVSASAAPAGGREGGG